MEFSQYFEALESPLRPQVGPKLRPCWVSWGRLGGSWALLGGYLAVLNPKKTEVRCNCFENSIRKRILIDFDSENGPLRPSKIMKFHWFYDIFQLFATFEIRSIFDPILVPTWLHFGRILGVLGASWRYLGRILGVLGRQGPSLGRLGDVLEASWAPKPPQHKPDSTWNGKRCSY